MKTVLTVCAALLSASVSAQYITPTYRSSDADVDFAHWWGFYSAFGDVAYTPEDPPYSGLSYGDVNIPSAGGNTLARLGQYRASGAFLTGSAGIYSFGDATAFKVYDNPAYSPGDILFQTVTLAGSQSIPDFSTVKLYYRASEADPFIEAPIEVTAAVNSTDSDGHIYTAWEWDASSLTIADYYIEFAYPLNHSSFVEAQLDTNPTFALQIDGFGLTTATSIPTGFTTGSITRSPSKSFYNEGESVTVTMTPNQFFTFVKWITPDGDSTDNPITVTMDEDIELVAVLAAKEYDVWRQFGFPSFHGGDLTAADWNPDVDYDADSKPNVLEYGLGEDPESGVSEAQIYQTFVTINDVEYPAIVFPQQVAATDLNYSVSQSTDLINWDTNGDAGSPFTAAPEVLSFNDNGTQQVRVRSLTPVNAHPMFFQLNVELD